jgi:hypothetical protein
VCAGAAAGVVSWALVYPMDVVKSVIMTQPLNAPAEARRLIPTINRLYRVSGSKGRPEAGAVGHTSLMRGLGWIDCALVLNHRR